MFAFKKERGVAKRCIEVGMFVRSFFTLLDKLIFFILFTDIGNFHMINGGGELGPIEWLHMICYM